MKGTKQATLAVLASLAAAASVLVALALPGAAAAAGPTMDMQVSRDAAAVQSWAAGQGGTGVFWDPAAKTFVTRVPQARIGAMSAALAAVRQTPRGARMGLPVSIRPAVASAQDINAGLAILRKQDWTPTVKKYSWAFYYDIQRDVTVVQTNAPASVTDALKRLMKNPIDLQHSAYHQDSRNVDKSPFSGGAAMINVSAANKEECTAGFGIKSDELGYSMMLTAGHCGNVGDTFKVFGSAQNSPGNTVVGTVAEKAPFPMYDSELIACSGSCASGQLWIGATTKEAVKGEDEPIDGENDWFTSGAVSNYHGGRTIDSTSAELCQDGECTSGLVSFHGTTVCQSGDSGAPLFRENLDGAGAWVGGTYVGADGSEMYAENWVSLQNLYSGAPTPITS